MNLTISHPIDDGCEHSGRCTECQQDFCKEETSILTWEEKNDLRHAEMVQLVRKGWSRNAISSQLHCHKDTILHAMNREKNGELGFLETSSRDRLENLKPASALFKPWKGARLVAPGKEGPSGSPDPA